MKHISINLIGLLIECLQKLAIIYTQILLKKILYLN